MFCIYLGLTIFISMILICYLSDKFYYINIGKELKKINPEKLNEAQESAKNSKKGDLSEILPYTENNPNWTLLYNHIRKGQIDPRKMSRMRREDLDYLAGMENPHLDLSKDELAKLNGNVSRAKQEINNRNLCWTMFFTVSAAIIGAYIGGVIS